MMATMPPRSACCGTSSKNRSRTCPMRAQLFDDVHCSHGAHLVCIAEESSSRRNEADLAAVSLQSSASSFLRVVVDAVVIATQHRQIRRVRVTAIFMGIDMVYLASISRHVTVWPRAYEIFRGGHNPLLKRREPRLVEIDGASSGVEQPGVEGLA